MVTVADSIGIKLLAPDCLLAGVGNELHQYYLDANNKTVHHEICLRFRCKIYGISKYDEPKSLCSSPFVVAYGGRELAVLHLSSDNNLKLIKTLSLNDWISSIQVYKPKSNGSAHQNGEEVSFCVVSAHSVASEFKVKTNGEWSIGNKASCVDKCTLYSSLIIGNEWSETIVFGGTAFGELIIWKAHGSGMNREVLQRLSGHNGVIFSINCSISNNIITTTSDDRSVKIWNLNIPGNSSCAIDWEKVSIEASKSMFGHTSRIFNHKIIEYNNKVFIITVGEDGTVCVWAPDGRLINRHPINANISLWNCDYDPSRQYLFACGNDGNIHQLSLKNILDETEFRCENFIINDFNDGEYVEKLVIMQEEAIVIMLTNERKLFYGKIMENLAECTWRPVPMAETDYKITVLETHGSLVATAGYQFITIYQFKNGQFNKVYHDKPPSVENSPLLRSLKFLTENELVICNARGNGSILTIDESFHIIRDQSFEMPPCKERWITVAARFENYLVVGDRHGNMHLYEIGDTLQLKHTLWRVHGNLGCKSIFQTNADDRLQFECAGHQSKVKTIVLNDQTQELQLKSTHEIPIKWCDKAVPIDSNRNILLAGFNERHFIAWRHDNSFRFEFDCGGGHRACDLHVDRVTSKAHLFFVRSKLLNCVQFDLHDSSLHPFNITNIDWHSRPCNTMRIIELTKQRFLIASGGDDNLLKFTEINMIEPITLKHHFDMVLHISNIRAIFSLRLSRNDDNENWIIFSAGGRAQICVTDIQIDHKRNVQFHEVCDFMLRSSDLHRKRTKQTQIIYFDPETRFMSLVAFGKANEIHLVVGCSDGFVRTFTYANGSIALDTSTFYGRCFLNVHHFVYNDQNYLITMATDGLIAFWSLDDFTEDSKPFFNVQHHDSGINSFDVFIDDTDKMVIATGGDDQAIVISILQLESNAKKIKVSIVKTVKFPYDHTAQVNGLKFSDDKKYLHSTSVDQTVMRVDLNDFSIQQVGYSCISDAKGIQNIDSNHVLVYGCGVQILNV